MAAGITQITVLDGLGVSRSMQVWSSTGLVTGNLNPLQTITGVDAATPASASNPFPVSSVAPYASTPKGYYQATSGLSAAITLATIAGGSVPSGATFAVVECEAVDVRWRDDGTNPTASVGMLLSNGQTVTFSGASMNAVKFILTQAGSILNVSFYS